MVASITMAVALALALPASEVKAGRHSTFLRALAAVDGAEGRNGDGGRAIGPFQIHRGYWRDAVEQEPSLRRAGYAACRDYAYGAKVVTAYMQRHAPQAWRRQDWIMLAAIHNAGGRGARQGRAKDFARRVMNVMREYERPAATNGGA